MTAKIKTKVKSQKALILVAVLGLGWAWHKHINNSVLAEDSSLIDSPETTSRRLRAATTIPGNSTPALKNETGRTSRDIGNQADHEESNKEGAFNNKLNEARALIDAGSLEEGAKLLEDLIKEDQTNTSAMMELAMLYTLDFKDPARARTVLERILDVAPDHRAALAELELVYRETGTVEEGLETLQLKAQQNPQSKDLQYAYGRLLSQSNPAAALSWIKRGTEIADVKEEAYNDLAAAALRAGQYSLAIESWTEALRLAEIALEQAKTNGEPGIDYLEERIASTRTVLSNAKAQASKQ